MNLRSRWRLLAWLCVVPWLFSPAFAQVSGTITGSGCVNISTGSQATVAFQVSGSWSGTINPTASIQGGSVLAVQVTPSNSTTAQSTVTANGGYTAAVAGYDQFQLCGGTVTGTAVIHVNASAARNGGGSGGGGSGTVTSVDGSGQNGVETESGDTPGAITTSGVVRAVEVAKTVTTTPYTLLASDRGTLLILNFGSGAATVNLPTSGAGFVAGFIVHVKNTSTGFPALTPASGTIDGQSSINLLASAQVSFDLIFDGTNWQSNNVGASQFYNDASTVGSTVGLFLASQTASPGMALRVIRHQDIDAVVLNYTDANFSLANKPSVGLVADANVTLSGAQTIDSVLGTAGTTLVLATAQTSGSENGPWIMQSGAWTRPAWYPSGGTTQAYQFITTFVRLGTKYSGSTWRITTSGAITIDTTATTWTEALLGTSLGSAFANTALSNLASVAINTALLPGTDNSIALGGASFRWSDAFITAFSTKQTFAGVGAASTPGVLITGASFAGTGTTSFPQIYYFCSGATAPTNWSTSGTILGYNACTGFAGKFLDFHINGNSSFFSVDSVGNIVNNGGITSAASIVGTSFQSNVASGPGVTVQAGATVRWGSTRSIMSSPADGVSLLTNAAATGFTRLDFGGTTSSFPAFQISGTTLIAGLADGTAGGALQATAFLTQTNCSNAASPAVCAAAAAGVVAVPTGTNPTLTINTTAVTANSRIFLQIDESATIAATTCNTTLSTLVQPVVTARSAGTSFTIQIGAIIATNPACVSYLVMN